MTFAPKKDANKICNKTEAILTFVKNKSFSQSLGCKEICNKLLILRDPDFSTDSMSVFYMLKSPVALSGNIASCHFTF